MGKDEVMELIENFMVKKDQLQQNLHVDKDQFYEPILFRSTHYADNSYL